jgi:hypothetical protein
MPRSVLWLLSSVLALGASMTDALAQAPSQASCDRACLRTLLDQYLGAVVAHDPSAAPLVVGFRQTENAINVRPGDGVWQSVTGLGEVQRRFLDPVSGQAAYYGTVKEGAETPIVTVRVRVENRELTEAEWYIARANDPGLRGARQPGQPPANLHNPEYLTQNPPPERVVPMDERADRATLMRIVGSYFDAITSHDTSVALTHPGCGRAENGTPAPGGRFLPPARPANGAAAASGGAANASGGAANASGAVNQQSGAANPASSGESAPIRDCVAGLENLNLSMVVARRIPVVDVEAQAVLAYGVFIRRPGSPTPRNAFSEWFFIDHGRIRTIYTAMFYPPPELAVPNWPPYNGNWPLPATIVPAAQPE